MIVRLLDRSMDRAGFSCGVEALDRYLQRQASQDVKNKVCACYVLLGGDGEAEILGYYTFSATSVELRSIPQVMKKKLPHYPRIPAVLLGRLAISETRKGAGLGRALLFDALKRAFKMSGEIGAWSVVVDAKDEQAAAFYEKHGFQTVEGEPLKLFLPIKTITALL